MKKIILLTITLFISTFQAQVWTNYNSSMSYTGLTLEGLNNKYLVEYYGDLMKFDGVNFTKVTSFQGSKVTKVFMDGANLWVGAQDAIYKLTGTTWTKYNVRTQFGITLLDVQGITKDSQGNLWFGSMNNLLKFNGASWVKYDTPNQEVITGLKFDSLGNLWLSSNYGILEFKEPNWIFTYEPTLSFNTINIDQNNNKWFSYLHYGMVFKLDTNSVLKVYTFQSDQNIDSTVSDIAFYGNNVLAASRTGFYILKSNETWQGFKTSNSNIGSNQVTGIGIDSNQFIWLSLDNGVSKLDYKSLLGANEVVNSLKKIVVSNPFHESLNIFSKSQKISQIQLFDLNGKLVTEESLNNLTQYQLNTEKLPKGIYIIVVTSEIGKESFKVVKN